MASDTPTFSKNGAPAEDRDLPLNTAQNGSARTNALASELFNHRVGNSLGDDSDSDISDAETVLANARSVLPHRPTPTVAMRRRLSLGTVAQLTPALPPSSAGATIFPHIRPILRPRPFIPNLHDNSQPGQHVRDATTLSYPDVVNLAYGLFVPAIKQDLTVHKRKSTVHIVFPSIKHDGGQCDNTLAVLEVAMWHVSGLARMSDSGRYALRHG